MPSTSTLASIPPAFDPAARILTHGSMIVLCGLLCVEKHTTVIRFDRVHIPLGPPRALFCRIGLGRAFYWLSLLDRCDQPFPLLVHSSIMPSICFCRSVACMSSLVDDPRQHYSFKLHP